MQLLGDQIDGLDWIARLLGAHGRVLPMADVPLESELTWKPRTGFQLFAASARSPQRGIVHDVRLIPENPTVPAEVLTAISEAEWSY